MCVKIRYDSSFLNDLALQTYQLLCLVSKIPIAAFFFVFSLNLQANEKIKAPLTIISGEWTPYVGESLPHHGFVSQIVTAAFSAVDQPINYKWLPWMRGEALIKRGRYFATFPYAKTDLRRQEFIFSDPIFYTRTSFFYYKIYNDRIHYQELSDIKHLRIGGIRGYVYVERLERAGLDLYLVNNTKQLVEMLERNRIDLIAINDSVGWYIINNSHAKNAEHFATLEKPVNDTHSTHLMISKDFPNALEMRAQFNKGLATILDNGVFQQIVEQLMPKGFKK